MTDVTIGWEQDHEPAELPAADEQLLRELTERARSGGLKLGGGFAGLPGAHAKIAPTVPCMIPLGSVSA